MKGDEMRRVRVLVAGLAAVSFGVWAAAAAAVTPGWMCIPSPNAINNGASPAVIAGGVGTAPSCTSGYTAVLAPTYVASGVGGKPTVVFNAVNLQVVSGSGATNGTPNGEGNVVIGYAENPSDHLQSGSNNLIVGYDNGWSGYGQLVAGESNMARGDYAAVFGVSDTAGGVGSLVAGASNRATGTESTVVGGKGNTAGVKWTSVLGGSGHSATKACQSIPATNTC